jgi:polyisoprenoid-binding protein YceI
MRSVIYPVCVVALLAMPSASAYSPATNPAGPAYGRLLIYDGTIAVRCPLTVGGSFDAKTKALNGQLTVDPEKQGAIDGTLSVDLRTLETGIGLRDNHMRENYLEVQKGEGYDSAILSDIHLDGVDPAQPVGKTSFRGVLQLHGQQREVTGTAEIRSADPSLRVQASFPVKVSEFGIASPKYLGVGVRDQVTVSVNFSAIPKR